jgi:alanine dehydrogenase
VRPTRVAILGAGSVGQGALRVAHGLGCDVVVLDVDGDKLADAAREFPGARALHSNGDSIAEAVAWADLLLNGVMWPPSRTGHLVTRDMVRGMKPGAVIVDVSADVSGALETCLRQTTLAEPTYVEEEHVHYVGANIPSLAARSASEALSAVTLPYALALADKGAPRAMLDDLGLRRGLTCIDGRFARAMTANWYGCEPMPEVEVEALLKARA